MSEPFIFIGTHTLREGKLKDFKEACRELVEVVEVNGLYAAERGWRCLRRAAG